MACLLDHGRAYRMVAARKILALPLLTAALGRFCDVEMPARNLRPETRRGYAYDLTEWVATTAPSLPVD